jgi:phage terminase large subunit-like protein
MSLSKDDKIALERYLAKIAHIKEFSQVNPNETETEKKKRIERAKKDYAFFVKYYFPHYANCECADFHIDAANQIKKNKFIVSIEEWARAHAKSTHFDIMIPFWLWINNDINVMLLVGKSEEDAKTLLSDLQAEFENNPQILADFGKQISLGDWQDGNFVTKNGKAFFSLGRGQSPRGVRHRQHRPDYIVCDDIDDDVLVKNPKRVKETVNWILEALFNTMDVNGARFVLVNNRIGSNTVLTNMVKRPNVKHRIVNALDKHGKPTWHQKYSLDYFKQRREQIGEYAFQKEFMNNPHVEGEIFKDEQIQFAPIPKLNTFDCIIAHWDVAYAGTSTGDYNAVVVWGLKGNEFYHIKAFVRQCKMYDAIKWMHDYEKTLPESIKIQWRFESQFWNDALKMTLEQVNKDCGKELNLIQCARPVTNKFDRIVGLQPYFQNLRVYFNEKEKYNLDMQTGLSQLKAIEPGYKSPDDAPDAYEGAITYLSKFIQGNNLLPILGKRDGGKQAW